MAVTRRDVLLGASATAALMPLAARADTPDVPIGIIYPFSGSSAQIGVDAKPHRFLKGLAINGGAFFTGARAINPQNSLFLPGYTLFDAGGSYEFMLAGVDLTARVYAQNITGKRYFASTGGNYISYGVPSSVKFSLSAKL